MALDEKMPVRTTAAIEYCRANCVTPIRIKENFGLFILVSPLPIGTHPFACIVALVASIFVRIRSIGGFEAGLPIGQMLATCTEPSLAIAK
jgi:hypothetical protein